MPGDGGRRDGHVSGTAIAPASASGCGRGELPRILEINPAHPLIRQMASRAAAGNGEPELRDAALLLLDQARIVEGAQVHRPLAAPRGDHGARSCALAVRAQLNHSNSPQTMQQGRSAETCHPFGKEATKAQERCRLRLRDGLDGRRAAEAPAALSGRCVTDYAPTRSRSPLRVSY